MATKRIKDLATSITAFRTGDYIAVDGTDTAKMSKDDLLKETAQNALAGNVAPSFDPTRDNTNPYKAGESVAYEGKTYTFKVDHYGAWNASDVFADSIDDVINKDLSYSAGNISLGTINTGYYYNGYGLLVSNADSAYCEITLTPPIDGLYIEIDYKAYGSNGRYCLLYDDNGNKVESFVLGQHLAPGSGLRVGKYIFENSPKTSYVLKLSWDTRDTGGQPVPEYIAVRLSLRSEIAKVLSTANKVMYVSSSGNDGNDGLTKENAKKTITNAVQSGAQTVIVDGGNYDDNTIDISKSLMDHVVIKGMAGKKPIFRRTQAEYIKSGTETLVSGYTKVYSISASDPKYAVNAQNQWLYFDDLPEASTAIDPTEAHPLERGLYYRNDCTRIFECTSLTLADALAEIESADVYKWFYSSGTLYFGRGADDTSVKPIYRPSGNYFVTRENQSLTLENIEFRYGKVNLANMNVVNVLNVSSKYIRDDCFMYDDTISIKFERCEACGAHLNNTGDGFNGHAHASVGSTAKVCTCRLVECWSHDNLDDGYSDHEFAETTIDGGLFEYNGKAGVTPSFGSHCVCNNVYSRHNYNGFYYPGSPNDGGNGGQMICYNCVSESNDNRANTSDCGFKVGDSPNRAILVNCKSINNKVDFGCVNGATMTIIDCGVSGTINTRFDGSGFEIISTEIVS